MRKSVTPSREMVTVTFKFYWRVKIVLEEGRWTYYDSWMPRGKEVTLDIPINAFHMLQTEKDEGASNQGIDVDHPYYNARRYYRMLVILELNKPSTPPIIQTKEAEYDQDQG